MKLLVVTQALDVQDPVLGFFARWVDMFALRVEHVTVVALRLGAYDRPVNVTAFGLSDRGAGVPVLRKVTRSLKFLWYVWAFRNSYDTVLVHMNQEYVVIAGWLWRLMGKRVCMWRNHYAGSWVTDYAASQCYKVFCTSKHSYTARYANTVLMPVGVDAEEFLTQTGVHRVQKSVLFLSRIAPSKRVELLIEALAIVRGRGVDCTATIVGSPKTEDQDYYATIQGRVLASGLGAVVRFTPGVPHHMTTSLYQGHDVFVNCSRSGMFDKVLFEAAASGCVVVATSKDWNELAGTQGFETADELATQLGAALTLTSDARTALSMRLKSLVQVHALPALADELVKEMNA